MESSNSKIYDPIRKNWVKRTPEEEMRQALLVDMVENLHYPPAYLSVEKELCKLPHLALVPKKEVPQRRADIVVFAKDIHPDFSLFPLLLIECKAVDLTPAVAQQVVGYNDSVGAPFIAVANGEKILTGHYDENMGMYTFKETLPNYQTLLESL